MVLVLLRNVMAMILAVPHNQGQFLRPRIEPSAFRLPRIRKANFMQLPLQMTLAV